MKRFLSKQALPDVDFEGGVAEADGADWGLGEPEFSGGMDQDGLRGFVKDADGDPDVPLDREEQNGILSSSHFRASQRSSEWTQRS